MNEFRIRYRLTHYRFPHHIAGSQDNFNITENDKIIQSYLNRYSSMSKQDAELMDMSNGYYIEEFLERIE